MPIRRLLVAVLAILVVFSVAQAFGQASLSYATLSGTVQDEAGRTVLKAAISVHDPDRNLTYTATTNESGYYIIPNLPPGTYELTVTNAGFAKYIRTGIPLSVGQMATVNVSLKVAATTEVVKVT